MGVISMIKPYLIQPKILGNLFPSSKYVARKVAGNIDFNSASYIAEYSPGMGAITEEIVKGRKEEAIILLFESNKELCRILDEKFKNERNLYIINDSVDKMEQYMVMYQIPWLDYIVSGLPLASLPHHLCANILRLSEKHLRQGGSFITFQYTLLKKELIEYFFKKVMVKRVLRNIPPAYIFCCSND